MGAMKRRPWWHAILTTAGEEEAILTAQPPALLWEMYRISARYKDSTFKYTVLNHIERNACLVTKKGLYLALRSYCEQHALNILSIIPRSFYLAPGSNRRSMQQDDLAAFEAFNAGIADESRSEGQDVRPEETIWILKPASKTNCGYGIKVVKGLQNVLQTVNRMSSASSHASEDRDGQELQPDILRKVARNIARQDGYIVQLYMKDPLLVDGRKFDIRCFVLVTVFRKEVRAYFFQDAYIRTSCKKYDLSKLSDRATHLTNDAVQKHSTAYGQYEDGNKLSLVEWQNSIERDYPHAPQQVVNNHIMPEIKRLSKISIDACLEQFRNTSIDKSFELFGYDFMVNQSFQPVLIEVNTNPCLEFVCPLLTDIISRVIEDSFKLAVDRACPPKGAARTRASQEAYQLIQNEGHSFQPLYP
jgi:hypothetical protein